MIDASPLNGGADLTGKSGRKTADACDAIAKETKIRTAARFIFAKNAFTEGPPTLCSLVANLYCGPLVPILS
jgi:hypothetical protein